MKYKNQVFIKINPEHIEQKFQEEILPKTCGYAPPFLKG
jgi:hypothetical protein